MNKTTACGLFASIVLSAALAFVACSDDNASAVKEPTPDGGGGTSSEDGGPTDCVQNPKTHLEIINACTTATRIKRDPVLSKLQPDGGLPPLN